jgi:hypothetical protein
VLKSVPVINLLLPARVPCSGAHQIAVFGTGFRSTRKLAIRFGSKVCLAKVFGYSFVCCYLTFVIFGC